MSNYIPQKVMGTYMGTHGQNLNYSLGPLLLTWFDFSPDMEK